MNPDSLIDVIQSSKKEILAKIDEIIMEIRAMRQEQLNVNYSIKEPVTKLESSK